jgi:methanogenic corrinoid protein MtbC1
MSSCGDAGLGARSRRGQLEALLAARPGASEARLASVIFGDILPRLQMLHQDFAAQDAERAFTKDEVVAFGEILILDDGDAADVFLQKMRARGHAEDSLLLGLLSETARHLGALWEDDRCSFVEVTISVARLQKMLCAIGGPCEPAVLDGRQRAALCAMRGETHVFGLDMVACFMRQACWDVDVHKETGADDVADLVGGAWFAVLGFTLSSELGLDALCRAIKVGRAASSNPNIGVLVGGPLFRNKPDLVTQVGADAVASDAASATLLAKKLLLRQSQKAPSTNGHFAAAIPPADAQSSIQFSKA